MPTALITGASAGIGMELAKLFAQDHHDLILVARRKEKLEQLAYDLREIHGVSVHVIASDLGEPGAARALFEETTREGLQVEFLVNNAGIGQNGLFAELDEAEMMTMITLNMSALTQLTRLYLPDMLIRKRGRIMNVGSMAGFQPGPRMAVYYATKAYVYSLTEALVEELRGTPVTITNLAPGATQTEFQERAGMHNTMLFALGAMSGEAVARAGYKGMMRGDGLVVPGLQNKLAPGLIPLFPRAIVRRIAHRINKDK